MSWGVVLPKSSWNLNVQNYLMLFNCHAKTREVLVSSGTALWYFAVSDIPSQQNRQEIASCLGTSTLRREQSSSAVTDPVVSPTSHRLISSETRRLSRAQQAAEDGERKEDRTVIPEDTEPAFNKTNNTPGCLGLSPSPSYKRPPDAKEHADAGG